MAEIGLTGSIIAVIDLSAKVASQCSEYYVKVKNARDDIEHLQEEIGQLKAILGRAQSLCDGAFGAKLQSSQNLRNGVKECKKQLAQLETKLEPRKYVLMNRFGRRALTWPFESHEVEEIMKKLGKCKDSVSFSLQFDQIVQVLSIHQEIVLNRLRSADDAAFDSHAEEHNARCYKGTRVQLLRQINTWASDPSSECIFWLNGMAGTGKSTISRTVAQNFAKEGELGASFFFKRGEGGRDHAGLFFSTIAAQLVQKLPSLAPHVRDAIEADPAIPNKALKQQFETLVLQPFGKIRLGPQESSRIVIVVDALDECNQEEDLNVIIHLLQQVQRITSVRLKFFLTSRPELPIRLGFEDISGRYKCVVLHEIPIPIIEHDISAFLEYELARIRDEYNKSVIPDRQLPTDWPGEANIQSLVEMAIPLFIFAATICLFVKDRRCGEPGEQLAKVLKYKTKSQESALDATYLPVLDQLLVGLTNSRKDELVEKFEEVVGSIVILASPLSTVSLARLLDIPKARVDHILDLLHSVLSIPSNQDMPVRLLHLSFRDFLLDSEKREEHPFWISEQKGHRRLATECLQTLSKGLKKDICNLQVPERLREDVDRQTIKAEIPPDIQYACQYWVYHLKEGRSTICDDDQVHKFLRRHFLHWLEALSFIQRLPEAISMINALIVMLRPTASIELSALLYDARRFILRYLPISDLSPLQLYSSALIFAPKESVIRQVFQNYIPDYISQQPGAESRWNATLQTLEGHGCEVNSVAFSHDSKLLATASGKRSNVRLSGDNTVKIWNLAAGIMQETLEGHRSVVTSVVFSHNSKMLASASYDRTIRIWDMTTSTLYKTLEGHSTGVTSVVFSHDSKLLASASGDNTAKIWNMDTGTMQQTLEGHSSWITSVAFSHDSKLLASASADKTLRIWDAATGTLEQTLDGHSDLVFSVVFSHDSRLLASASYDNTIRVWNVAIGTLQETLEGHISSVRAVAFSHDSKLLASGSCDNTVIIWDVAKGTLQETLKGHSHVVTSVVFSHNSKLLASASCDKTVRIWDASMGTLQQTLEAHSSSVLLVVFSQDLKLLASASADKTVKIWDATTGRLQQTLKSHSSSVAFSHDSRLLASASYDNTIRVWDVAIGTLQYMLEGYSSSVQSVAFSHDTELLALASGDAPDNETVKLWSNNIVKIWNMTKDTLQELLDGHSDYIYSIVFSYDSKLVASASADKTVMIWDAATGTLQQTLKSHSNSVTSVVFSHNSKLLASTSHDKTVRIWDATTGTLQRTIPANGYISSLLFDIADSNLITNIGRINLGKPELVSVSESSQEGGRKSDRKGLAMSGSWIMWNSQNLLWLPPDYRPLHSGVSLLRESRLAIGCKSGKVVIIGFSLAILNSSYS